MSLEEFEITGAVDDYIRSCLRKGTTLSKKISARKDISKAVKYSYWQKDFPLNTERDFGITIVDRTMKIDNIYGITTKWIIQKIQKYINSDKHAIAVFEESLIDSNDGSLKDSDTQPYFISEINIYKGKEVYYFIEQRYSTQAYIQASLCDSGRAGPFSTTALIKLPDEIRIEKDIQVSENMLEILADNVDHMVFGAFDLDGYIICSFKNKL